jgi:hypothetical protein
MRVCTFLLVVAALLAPTSITYAQDDDDHSDVEFGYDNTTTRTAFDIEQDNRTSEGFQFFESEIVDEFMNGDFGTDAPGFASHPDEDLFINTGDRIFLNILKADDFSTFGRGYVNYYDPNTDSISAFGRMSINDNLGEPDLVLDGATIESGNGPQFIDIGVNDEVHDHLEFDLLDDATTPFGAYGLLAQLQSDFGTADGTMDLSSDPFWIIFNHGMDETDFDANALAAFGAVPEPGTASLLLIGTIGLALRRRKS